MTNVQYGTKMGMVSAYLGDKSMGVTKIALLPMTISQVKTVEKDGYQAVQVAFAGGKSRINKARAGHLKSAGVKVGMTREIPFSEGSIVGTAITPDSVVKLGAYVKVQSTSKGKGYAGVVKRYHFAGGPKTHGQSDRLRAPGSIGQGTTPGRVYKGKHMAGRMGTDTVSVKSVVVAFDPSSNSAWISGPVPGSRGSLVRLEVTGYDEKMTTPATISGSKG